MHRVVLAALVAGAALAPASTSSAAPPPLPCTYWVHGCNVLDYVCETGICSDIQLPPKPISKD